MMTRTLAETLVADHRTALVRDAAVHRLLRRRAAGAVVRTSAPVARAVAGPPSRTVCEADRVADRRVRAGAHA